LINYCPLFVRLSFSFPSADRDHGIQSIYQEAFENERANKTTFIKKKFNSLNLFQQNDCSHWCDSTHRPIDNLKAIPLPANYEALYPWTTAESYQTDAAGWRYSQNFDENGDWSASCQSDSLVRRRRWHRVVVPTSQANISRTTLNRFYQTLSLYRAMNFQLMDRALGRTPHHFQTIYEFQHLANGSYSSSTLSSSNMPAWATQVDPMSDPLSCSSDSLTVSDSSDSSTARRLISIEKFSFHCPAGWVRLHDFIYSIQLDTDALGWVYSSSSSSWSNPSSDPSSSLPYRRRQWFRTIVQMRHLSASRSALSSYIASHPRGGTIQQGHLYKKSTYQQLWLSCSAVLTDQALILSSSQENKSYPLSGLEVVPLKSHQCLGYQNGFALRKKAFDDSVCALICSLTSDVSSEVIMWSQLIAHQIALTSTDFNSLYFGPIISDPIVLSDDMWKRSELLLVWRLRTLQLHQSGYLVYFHGAQIRDRIDLFGCQISQTGPASLSQTAPLSSLAPQDGSPLLSSSRSLSSVDLSQPPNGSDFDRTFTVRRSVTSLPLSLLLV
jgi:hypothetical protein